jgi:Coenzyme PQQ synthesis protein D (PqqD)
MNRISTDMTELLDAKASIPTDVVYRDFMHETVILNLQTGKYHGLNPTAGRMLQVLEREPRLRDAVQTLADDYAQPFDTVAQDLCEFCLQLEERGLLSLERRDGS